MNPNTALPMAKRALRDVPGSNRPERESTFRMKIDPNDFRVPDGKKIRLKEWATGIRALYNSEKEYKELLAADVGDLSALQRLL